MLGLAAIARRAEQSGGRLPMLTLAEFFDGNPVEESIAPNQWGDGRPSLGEIHRRLAQLEDCEDVAWVRVELHEDWAMDPAGVPAAESVAICTSAAADEIERRLGAVEELASDGVMEGLSYEQDSFTDIPPIPPGYRLTSLVWD